MVAIFTGRTFAVHQIHPEIANTDARPVLDQRHSENNGLTSARTRTCSALRGPQRGMRWHDWPPARRCGDA